MSTEQTRRRFLQRSLGTAGATLGGLAALPNSTLWAADAKPKEKLPVAAVVTVYRKNSHADVIVGKVLEGWRQDGGAGPDLKLVSMFADQIPEHDMCVSMSKKYGYRVSKTIEDALTLGTDKLAVGGVLIVGEHGNYPLTPDTQQVMHPRRRFFDEVVATFRKCGKIVPIFNDKHLSHAWADAAHMYETAKKMQIPFMAGSSIPVAWRSPSTTIPLGTEVTEAIALGYGPLEHYGFHSLEGMQCLLERRKGGETGVKSVQSVQGADILRARDAGRWSQDVFDAVVAVSPTPYYGKVARPKEMAKDAVFYLIDYRDGTKATVAMGTGFTHEFSCALKIRGQAKPFALTYVVQDNDPFGQFEYQLRAIEQMFHTGKASYPIERTLLTTGILDAALHSLAAKSKLLETPELAVAYQPGDWPFPPGKPWRWP